MSDCIERKKGTIHPTPGLPKFGILSGNIKELFVEGKERSFNCAMNIQIYAIHVNVCIQKSVSLTRPHFSAYPKTGP